MQSQATSARLKTLKRLSDTRRGCRIESLKAISATLPAIISTLENIIEHGHNGRVTCEGRGLLNNVCSFQFILAFEIFLDILSLSKCLSDYLQQKNIDFISAIELVESLQVILQDKRSQEAFDAYFICAQEKCAELEIQEQDLPAPKRRRVSCKIDENQATQYIHSSGKDNSRVKFYYEVLDLMMGSLERRFSSHANQILQCFGVLNPKNFVYRQHQCNIEFLIDYCKDDNDPIALRREFFFTVPTTCSRPSTNLTVLSFACLRSP